MTDLRPQTQQPAAPPRPASQPAPPQPTFEPSPPAAPARAQPAPVPLTTTAELIAQHERATKPKTNRRRNMVLAVAGLLVVMAGTFLLAHHSPAKASGPFPVSITPTRVTIPVYYPKNLPAGFKVSGSKVVKQDVLNYVVTNQNSDSFYVNIESPPAGYNMAAFNKRFTNPMIYQTDIGKATAGLMNNQLICSIETSKSWVLINSTAIKSTADLQTIAKALKSVTL